MNDLIRAYLKVRYGDGWMEVSPVDFSAIPEWMEKAKKTAHVIVTLDREEMRQSCVTFMRHHCFTLIEDETATLQKHTASPILFFDLGSHGRRTITIQDRNAGCSALGDLLCDGKQVHGRKDIVLNLPESCAKYAPLLYGVIPVSVDLGEPSTVIDTMEHAPKIYLQRHEVERAAKLLQHIHNPLTVCVDCNPCWRWVRQGKIQAWRDVFNELARKFTLVQFGENDNFTAVQGAIRFMDMPLREVAACQHLIGKYVGVDTGLVHLTMAVGGKVCVGVPDDCPDHRWERWHYKNKDAAYVRLEELPTLPERARKLFA